MITFCVQGPEVFGSKSSTAKLITSLLAWYPDANIHRVTSEDVSYVYEKYSRVECLIVEDIGAINYPGQKPCNTNRQIQAIKKSLKHVDQQYFCKIRSDLVIKSKIDFFPLQAVASKESQIKMFVLDVTTKNFFDDISYVNHICDWVYFSSTPTANLFFDIEYYVPIEDHETQKLLPAEVYIWSSGINSLRRNGFLTGISDEKATLEIMEVIFAKDYGIRSSKFGYKPPFGINGFKGLTKWDWAFYKTYFTKSRVSASLIFFYNVSKLRKVYYFLKYHLIRFGILIRNFYLKILD